MTRSWRQILQHWSRSKEGESSREACKMFGDVGGDPGAGRARLHVRDERNSIMESFIFEIEKNEG